MGEVARHILRGGPMRATALIVAFLATLGFSQQAEAQQHPRVWQTEYQCNLALESGKYAVYVPADTRKKSVNRIDNKTIFGVYLPQEQCREQWTMLGWKYVVHPTTVPLRARKNAQGELVVFARDDCGNPDRGPAPAHDPVPQVIAASTGLTPNVAGVQQRSNDTTNANLNHRVSGGLTVTHKGGFWCGRGPIQIVVCTAIVATAYKLVTHDWSKPKPPEVETKPPTGGPPGVETKPPTGGGG